MKCERGAANELLLGQVVQHVHIISIIHVYLKILGLLELVVYLDCCHELWVEVVEDALGLASFNPLPPFHLPEHAKRIRLGPNVQVGQIRTR